MVVHYILLYLSVFGQFTTSYEKEQKIIGLTVLSCTKKIQNFPEDLTLEKYPLIEKGLESFPPLPRQTFSFRSLCLVITRKYIYWTLGSYNKCFEHLATTANNDIVFPLNSITNPDYYCTRKCWFQSIQ